MNWFHKIFALLSSLKTAVTLLALLTLVLILGTFAESYYGQAYAYDFIYSSLFFYLILVFLAVNIVGAALIRLPPKKRLTGFYITHLGLLVILVGALFTLIGGLDGSLSLVPGKLSNTVQVEKKTVLYVEIPGKEVIQVPLPQRALPRNMNEAIPIPNLEKSKFSVRRYIPYAKEEVIYQRVQNTPVSGMAFQLKGPRQVVDGVLSSPPLDYPETLTFGPLKLFFLGELPDECQLPKTQTEASWFLVTSEKCQEFNELEARQEILTVNKRLTQMRMETHGAIFRLESPSLTELLIPNVSAWPLDTAMKPRFGAQNRIYPISSLFSNNAVLAYFQNQNFHVAILDSSNPVEFHQIDEKTDSSRAIELPWMGLKLFIQEKHAKALPRKHFKPGLPQADDKTPLRAVGIEANGSLHWVTTNAPPVGLPLAENPMANARFSLGFPTLRLPWGFELDRFNMDHDPGTKNPSNYESFVKVYDPGFENPSKSHIFMNNPLKKGKYTFYQASYFPWQQDQFGSVLQINYDPGRPFKYTGSVLLVLGTALHFYLRRKKNVQNAGTA